MLEENLDFKHEILEADIERLAQEIKARREQSEVKNLSDREIVKEALKSLSGLSQNQASSQTAQSKEDSSLDFLPGYMKSVPPEVKLEVEYLLDIAFHEGLSKANAEAKKSSPFVLDAFHDALAGKLYPELQKRGIVK